MLLRLRQLLHENAALRDALHWYAVQEHWRRHGTNPKGAPRRWKKSVAAQDRGSRARAVLDRYPNAHAPGLRMLWLAFWSARRAQQRRPASPIQRQLHVPAPRTQPIKD